MSAAYKRQVEENRAILLSIIALGQRNVPFRGLKRQKEKTVTLNFLFIGSPSITATHKKKA